MELPGEGPGAEVILSVGGNFGTMGGAGVLGGTKQTACFLLRRRMTCYYETTRSQTIPLTPTRLPTYHH